MASTIQISNEQKALEVLEKFLSTDDLGILAKSDIEFVAWPTLSVRFAGNHYNGTLRYSQIQALATLQKTIYYQYELITGKKQDRFSPSERDALELTISVDKGSTLLAMDLSAIMSFISAVSQKNITGTAATLGMAYIFGSGVSQLLKQSHERRVQAAQLAHERDLKEMEYNHQTRQKILDFDLESLRIETDLAPESSEDADEAEPKFTEIQIEVFNKLKNGPEIVSKAATSAYRAIESLAISGKDAESVEVNGIQFQDATAGVKPRKSPQKQSSGRKINDKIEDLKCTVIEVTNKDAGHGKAGFQCKFESTETDELFIWRPKTLDECPKALQKQITNQHHSKTPLPITVVVSKVYAKSYEIEVVLIYGKRPRSFKQMH